MSKSTTPPAGHNSGTPIAGDRLRSIVERIERLQEEIKGLNADKRDVMLEAKSAGFDPKVINALLKERKTDPSELDEMEMLLSLYRESIKA